MSADAGIYFGLNITAEARRTQRKYLLSVNAISNECERSPADNALLRDLLREFCPAPFGPAYDCSNRSKRFFSLTSVELIIKLIKVVLKAHPEGI